MDGQGAKWYRNIVENLNRLSRVHERYRQTTDDRQTDGRRHTCIANVNVSSGSLKTSGAIKRFVPMLPIFFAIFWMPLPFGRTVNDFRH